MSKEKKNIEIKDSKETKKENSVKENKTNEQNNEQEVQNEEITALKSKIDELEKQVEEYKDKFLRKSAEFENYKRRTENDQLNLIKYAAESFIVKLLPVVDDLERSLQHMENARDIESIKDGIKLVYDKLMKVFTEQGIKQIESVGKPFNVDYHEALMQRKDESADPHTILEEIQKGYIYKDKVIRHAQVIVSEDLSDVADNSESTNSNNSEEK
ncbi:MAG: nucleotide exchange factor GrpE [Ignavibacteriaceae bacterium]